MEIQGYSTCKALSVIFEMRPISDSTIMELETEQFLNLANSEVAQPAYLILFNNALPLNLISVKLKPILKLATLLCKIKGPIWALLIFHLISIFS